MTKTQIAAQSPVTVTAKTIAPNALSATLLANASLIPRVMTAAQKGHRQGVNASRNSRLEYTEEGKKMVIFLLFIEQIAAGGVSLRPSLVSGK